MLHEDGSDKTDDHANQAREYTGAPKLSSTATITAKNQPSERRSRRANKKIKRRILDACTDFVERLFYSWFMLFFCSHNRKEGEELTDREGHDVGDGEKDVSLDVILEAASKTDGAFENGQLVRCRFRSEKLRRPPAREIQTLEDVGEVVRLDAAGAVAEANDRAEPVVADVGSQQIRGHGGLEDVGRRHRDHAIGDRCHRDHEDTGAKVTDEAVTEKVITGAERGEEKTVRAAGRGRTIEFVSETIIRSGVVDSW